MDVANDGDQLDKLRLGCSIFLSHSGADKDFVRFLNEALCHSGYHVFYDEKSLPKAVPVSMRNILAELKDVKLAVLVLSDAFFTRTQHPMNELTTIVAAGIQMLPVFYGFSVDQFKTKCRDREWLTTWKRWVDEKVIKQDIIREWKDALEAVKRWVDEKASKEDIIEKWKGALEAVSYTNGIEYCKEATNTLELRNKIVATVCHILKPDLRWSAEGVQGMDRLCQVVSERFAERSHQTCTNSVVDMENESVSKQTMVGGMYGIAGIGKTTLCRALCDFFFKEFNGRVCHIELGDHSEPAVRKRLECILAWLTGGTTSPQFLSNDQLWNLLKDHNQLFRSPPVFLAIDNVQVGSMVEAEKYLGCGPFPSGSKIFLTSQSVNVLKDLLVGHNAFCSWIQSFTHLGFDEARKVFLCKIYSREHTALSHQQACVVDECVSMCTLNKSQSDYYPMLLIVLASYMRQTSLDPLQWQAKLEQLRRDGIFASTSTHIEKLERIFKCVYYSLTKDQQHMLVDLALYLPDALNQHWNVENIKKHWLNHYYPYQDVNLILSQIADLSLVEGRHMSMIRAGKCFHVHDLLREFVKKEGTKRCTRVFKEHQGVKPSWRPWVKRRVINRVGILRCHFEDPTLDLSRIKKIRMLHLIHNKGLKHVRLRGTAWSSLQSLIVKTSTPIKISIVKAHRAKRNRAFYVDVENCGITSEASYLHKNPNSGLTWRNVVSLQLQKVRMHGQLSVCLGGFQQLHTLDLADLPDLRRNLKLDRCPNIREIYLSNLPNLEAVSGLENSLNVEELFITSCSSLHSLVLLDKCASYVVEHCKALESIEVCQSQLEKICDAVAEGSLYVGACPLRRIIGLSQRKFIGDVNYSNEDISHEWSLTQRLECSPDMVIQMFGWFSEHRFEQQIRTTTINCFSLQDSGLSEIIMRDVQDTSIHILALACISASSLRKLEVRCSREEGGCGCHGLLRQPRFDYLKMALCNLTFECVSVLDLSSLENCSLMESLIICGCLSARKWPDFGKMTKLVRLEVLCPGSLAFWPSGLQNHPCLTNLCIMGSNQIPPEELLEVQSLSRQDWICSVAALDLLVDDVYSSRKDNLRIAKALMANNEKLLCIIGRVLVWSRDRQYQPTITYTKFFFNLSQLLYGLWVEADCTLHECTPACAKIQSTQMQLQECLQGLLSSKAIISALLETIPQGNFSWREPNFDKSDDKFRGTFGGKLHACFQFRLRSAYESLVLVCCASIQKFEVQLDDKEYELVGDIVGSFFDRWEQNENYGRLPLLLWDRVPEEYRLWSEMWDSSWVPATEGRMLSEMLIEHDLSAVRVADAVCRLQQLLCEGNMDARSVMLDEAVKKMYGTYHSRAFAAKKLHSHSIRKQWHHPVGCSCALLRWPICDADPEHNDFSGLGMDSINLLRRYGQVTHRNVQDPL